MLIAISISALTILWALWVVSTRSNTPVDTPSVPTATVIDGTQIIDITAKGGYSPRVVTAKAGVPTLLRFATRGTFDCSASVVIPSLSYQKFLPPSGIEEVPIPAEQATGTLRGLCAMGMYNFEIQFQ